MLVSAFHLGHSRFATLVTDITARKQAEETLRRLNEELEEKVRERTADLDHAVEQLRHSEERLKYLSSQLISSQETERQRLALELHDDLGQLLTVLKLQLRALQKDIPLGASKTRQDLETSIVFINEIIERVRRLSRNLRPAILEDLGLAAALRSLLEDFQKYENLDLTADLDDINNLLPLETQIHIYRIFQEALTNIARHAQATAVAVSIKKQPEGITFQVEDNGQGFDSSKILEIEISSRGLGLAAIDERVRMLKGTLDLWSQPSRGTRICFRVPISPG